MSSSSSSGAASAGPADGERDPLAVRDSRSGSLRAVAVDLEGGSLPVLTEEEEQDGSASGSENGDGESYSVNDAVEKMGFGPFQVKLLFVCGLCWMADAMEAMLLSFLSTSLECEWDLAKWEVALISSVVFVGMLLGSYAWGIFSDRYGRKVGYVATSGFTGFFGILSALSPNYWCILLSRFLVGFGLGGAPVAFSLFAEYVPTAKRGFYLLFFELFWTVGTIIEAGLGWALLPTLGWRGLLAASALPSVVLALLFPVIPESARFLVVAGKHDKAIHELRRISKQNKKEMPRGELVDKSSNQPRGSIADMFRQPYTKTTILLWFCWFAMAFVYYGLVLLTTEVYRLEPPCEPDTLDCKDLWTTDDYVGIFITTFAELPGLVLAASIVNRLGRKMTQGLLSLLVFGACLALMVEMPRLAENFLFFAARAFIFGSFSAIYVYTPEVYPTTLRTTAVGACVAFSRIGGLTSPFVAQGLLEDCNYASRLYPLAIYAGIALICGIITFLLPVETANRQLEDVAPTRIKKFGFDRRDALISEETLQDHGTPVEELVDSPESPVSSSRGSSRNRDKSRGTALSERRSSPPRSPAVVAGPRGAPAPGRRVAAPQGSRAAAGGKRAGKSSTTATSPPPSSPRAERRTSLHLRRPAKPASSSSSAGD